VRSSPTRIDKKVLRETAQAHMTLPHSENSFFSVRLGIWLQEDLTSLAAMVKRCPPQGAVNGVARSAENVDE